MTAPSSQPNARTAREHAADLQDRVGRLVLDESLHRIVRATDHGWVEIQADYLDALLRQVERLARERDEARQTRGRMKSRKATPRQIQILQLLADGYSRKDIAKALGISEHTVQSHLKRLREARGLKTDAQLVASSFRRHEIN